MSSARAWPKRRAPIDDSSQPKDPLETDRRNFRAYYASATETDAKLMGMLIYSFSALNLTIKHPRDPNDPGRALLEKFTNEAERMFTAAREALRASPTFRNLRESDRRRLERG